MNKPSILVTEPSADYELLDSGEGEKLERFGSIVLSRPDPQALWRKSLLVSEWKKADGHFTREGKNGDWSLKPTVPKLWDISFVDLGLKFRIKPTPFKHVGIFPEQLSNWQWVNEKIKAMSSGDTSLGAIRGRVAERERPQEAESNVSPELVAPEILNLFGYTGGATLACAQAGAKVVHVDGSKSALAWARENAELSGLDKKPIRWILDDARAFVRREIKRGRKYDGIIMDPPAFGHGPEGEAWKIEEDFLLLVEECTKLLSDKPIFFLVNGYSAGYSAIGYENLLLDIKKRFGGGIEIGELTIQEKSSKRLLPCGIFARWSL